MQDYSLEEANNQMLRDGETKIEFPELTYEESEPIDNLPEEEEEEEKNLSEVLKDVGLSKYNDYQQLVYLGKIEDCYDAFGHTFDVRSISAEEELKISNFISRYADTISWNKALWIEALAYTLVKVDGEYFGGIPLGPDQEEQTIARRRDILNTWSPLIINDLYEIIYLDLRQRERQVVAYIKALHRVGKKSTFSDSQKNAMSS